MRSEAVLLVLSAALGACGRFGFADSPADATSGDDAVVAGDAGHPDAAANAIDITVHDRQGGKGKPVAGTLVVVVDSVQKQVLDPDAAGQVHAIVSGTATVHVAVPVPSSRWAITTYEDIPPGSSILVGPPQDGELGTLHSIPVGVVAGASFYGTVIPQECGGAAGTSANMAVFNSLSVCESVAIPIVVRAVDVSDNVLQILSTTVTPGTTSSISTPFQAPTVNEVAFSPNPLLSFFAARTWHRDGARWINTTGQYTSQTSNVARVLTTDQSVDRVGLSWGTGLHTHEVVTPVAPAVGNRSTVDGERDVQTLASITRGANHTINWTYAVSTPVHTGSVLAMHEEYGNVTHVYIVDPSRTSVTRPQLPPPLDTLYAGADVTGIYALVIQLDEQTFAESLYRAEDAAAGYTPTNDYYARESLNVSL